MCHQRLLPAISASTAMLAALASPAAAQPSGAAPPRFARLETIPAAPAPRSASDSGLDDNGHDIIVTASRVDVLGRATTASQGIITRKEVELRPIYRAAQMFESIPGLVVTVHSGEGKANQYLIRGYNLDHGTDFANFIDDMPVNRPTNTHGQGYSDLNFLMPQIVSQIDYTKGPYHAAVGDFGAVASSHVQLANDIRNQVSATIGAEGYQDLFAGGTYRITDVQRVMGAVNVSHYDGPWHPPQNFRKINAILRYSQGSAADGASLTAMYYQSAGGLITDQPERAITQGLIDRFGTLDPTDHSRSLRYSLSAHVARPVADGQVSATLYGIHSTMTLWSNFTHYLDDPINGDQEAQSESRTTLGGVAEGSQHFGIGSIGIDILAGLQGRYDTVFVARQHTLRRRTVLDYCTLERDDGTITTYPAVGSYCNADRVHLLDLAPYVQATIAWLPWLRTVAGFREDYYHATDTSRVTGSAGRGSQWLAQPKGSLILGPWIKTELYFSAGRGFHSDDVRGVFGTVPEQGIPLAGGKTPLLARTSGFEIGLRTNIVPKLMLQLAAFQQDFRSELTYNADSGQDEAGAPSRRKGVEVSGQFHPWAWLELNADLAFSRPRYRTHDLAAYGLNQPYIADAPNFIYSAGLLIDRLGPWSAGLQWRRLGSHSLDDGNKYPMDRGYSEWNLDVSYRLPHDFAVQLSIFNIFNSHDAAADYYYTTRLPGEAAEGIAGFQTHPLEPRTARLSLTKYF